MLNKTNQILSIILLLLVSLFFADSLSAGQAAFPRTVQQNEPRTISYEIQSKRVDPRTQILTDYFAKYNSPLENHAQDFIDAADVYDVDWKLVPAIAGVESTFGKNIPGGYNAWGWGVYGNQALGFKTWRDGIFTVTGGLKKNYIDRGLTNPYAMNRIYATSPAWGGKVTYFMRDLENFAKNQKTQAPADQKVSKTAGASAQLVFK